MIWLAIGFVFFIVCLCISSNPTIKEVICLFAIVCIILPLLVGSVIGAFVVPNQETREHIVQDYELLKLDEDNYIWYTRNGNIVYNTRETGLAVNHPDYYTNLELTDETPHVVNIIYKGFVPFTTPWWFGIELGKDTITTFYLNSLDRTIF